MLWLWVWPEVASCSETQGSVSSSKCFSEDKAQYISNSSESMVESIVCVTQNLAFYKYSITFGKVGKKKRNILVKKIKNGKS